MQALLPSHVFAGDGSASKRVKASVATAEPRAPHDAGAEARLPHAKYVLRRAPMSQYRLEFFEDEDGDQPVRRWLREELTRTQRLVVGTAMREILEEVGIDVCGSEYGRQLGQGLFEFRLREPR